MTYINSIFYNLPGMYMGDSYKPGQQIDYTTNDKKKLRLTVEKIANPAIVGPEEKYIVSGQLSPSSPPFIARLPSLNLANAEEAAQSLEKQIKEQKGKDMEEIKKMASEMGLEIGKYKFKGGRRTRKRRKRRRKKRSRRKKGGECEQLSFKEQLAQIKGFLKMIQMSNEKDAIDAILRDVEVDLENGRIDEEEFNKIKEKVKKDLERDKTNYLLSLDNKIKKYVETDGPVSEGNDKCQKKTLFGRRVVDKCKSGFICEENCKPFLKSSASVELEKNIKDDLECLSIYEDSLEDDMKMNSQKFDWKNDNQQTAARFKARPDCHNLITLGGPSEGVRDVEEILTRIPPPQCGGRKKRRRGTKKKRRRRTKKKRRRRRRKTRK